MFNQFKFIFVMIISVSMDSLVLKAEHTHTHTQREGLSLSLFSVMLWKLLPVFAWRFLCGCACCWQRVGGPASVQHSVGKGEKKSAEFQAKKYSSCSLNRYVHQIQRFAYVDKQYEIFENNARFPVRRFTCNLFPQCPI